MNRRRFETAFWTYYKNCHIYTYRCIDQAKLVSSLDISRCLPEHSLRFFVQVIRKIKTPATISHVLACQKELSQLPVKSNNNPKKRQSVNTYNLISSSPTTIAFNLPPPLTSRTSNQPKARQPALSSHFCQKADLWAFACQASISGWLLKVLFQRSWFLALSWWVLMTSVIHSEFNSDFRTVHLCTYAYRQAVVQ